MMQIRKRSYFSKQCVKKYKILFQNMLNRLKTDWKKFSEEVKKMDVKCNVNVIYISAKCNTYIC